MSTLTVTNPDLDLAVTLVDQQTLSVTVGQPVISVTVANPGLGLTVAVAEQPIIDVEVSPTQITTNVVGGNWLVTPSTVPGPKGDQGDRGSTFLGGYPSLINLPPIDGVDVKDGDFVLVRDTSTVFQVRP